MKRETKETMGALTIAAVAGAVCDPLSSFDVDDGTTFPDTPDGYAQAVEDFRRLCESIESGKAVR